MKAKAHLRWRARLLRGIVLAVVAAAVVVPAGNARRDLDAQPALKAAAYIPFVSDFPKASASTEPTVIPYLSHGYGVGEKPATGLIRADGPDGVRPDTHVVLVSTSAADDGFEWQPFSIGAAGGLALALLVAAASLVGVRRRSGVALS